MDLHDHESDGGREARARWGRTSRSLRYKNWKYYIMWMGKANIIK